jgi:hypothetical protein
VKIKCHFFAGPKLSIRMGFTDVATVLGVVVSVAEYMKNIGVTGVDETEFMYDELASDGILYTNDDKRLPGLLCFPLPHDITEKMELNGEHVVVGIPLVGSDEDGKYKNLCSLGELVVVQKVFSIFVEELQKLNPGLASLFEVKDPHSDLQIISITDGCRCCS